MTFYDEYKPLRNVIRRFELVTGLTGVWGYALRLMHDRLLPAGFADGLPRHLLRRIVEFVYPWDLDVIAKELLLHASPTGSMRLERWADLAKVVKHVRRLDDLAFVQPGAPEVFHEVHRAVHRQFPWQQRTTVTGMARYLKVFGAEALEDIAARELGMSVRQFVLLGAAVQGHFLSRSAMSIDQGYGVLGIGREQSVAFFDRLAATPAQLKSEISRKVSYGPDWLYTWNPLEQWPLVRYDPAHPERVICPLPAYLIRRVSGGIFYDLVKSKGFNNPFGDAFEVYIGEVIALTCPAPRFRTVRDEAYRVGRQEQRGVDWVLADGTAQIAIECKAKRLRLDARTLADPAALSGELDALARAIVQHYRNIQNAVAGRAPWMPDGSPIYPLVLTLEDWFLVGTTANKILDTHVRRRLGEAGIPERVLDDMPYTVASAREFETLAQIVSEAGIQRVLHAKTRPDTRKWGLEPFLGTHFREEFGRATRMLFSEDFEEMLPPGARRASRRTPP